MCGVCVCRCLAQVAASPDGRAALLQDQSVLDALHAVAGEAALSEGARQHAQCALLALSDQQLETISEGQKHVMLSYQWDDQSILCRTNESLITRGYATWFDLNNMKGNTADCTCSDRYRSESTALQTGFNWIFFKRVSKLLTMQVPRAGMASAIEGSAVMLYGVR